MLEDDSKLQFPNFVIMRASAGSGKTYNLSNRFAQYLLSDVIKFNGLRNILAITFSNNAAKEMRARILNLLKGAALGREDALDRLKSLLSMTEDEIIAKATKTVEAIIDNYSDFQVKTIDSFMTGIFKASALDFGYHPDFDILMDADSLMDYTFSVFIKDIGSDDIPLTGLLERSIELIVENRDEESAYLWNPSKDLLKEIKGLYLRLSADTATPMLSDRTEEMRKKEQETWQLAKAILSIIKAESLKVDGRSARDIERWTVRDWLEKGKNQCPLTKDNAKKNNAAYEEVSNKWEQLKQLSSDYRELQCFNYYQPYLALFTRFVEVLDKVKRQQGRLYIGDISKALSEFIKADVIPDLYFRLGDRICHFMIDEFQDTSPIQWMNLRPLVENALGGYGSLFIVGDTKQSIYRFRNSDYRIMKSLEGGALRPDLRKIVDLDTNYRSDAEILRFNEWLFQKGLNDRSDLKHNLDRYLSAMQMSGLTDYKQYPLPERAQDGYVEVLHVDANNGSEREELLRLVRDLTGRGYSDIAIISQKNQTVLDISAWLNEGGVPFVSMSNLDIRRRPVIGSIIDLLRFLNMPNDNLAFASFIRGAPFIKASGMQVHDIDSFLRAHKGTSFLYKAFRDCYSGHWERYLEHLFNASGYYPLYDLLIDIYAIFSVPENFKDEEAALMRLLEIVGCLEMEGATGLRGLLKSFDDLSSEDSLWEMVAPQYVDAVSVMTIHKAKGLGFPVVIALLYDERPKGFPYILAKEGNNVAMFKITSSDCNYSDRLMSLYEEEAAQELVSKLNLLYVCLTRAKHEMYVIHPKGRYASIVSDLLPKDMSSGNKRRINKDSKTVSVCKDSPFEIRPTRISQSHPNNLSRNEAKRGEYIHRILSSIGILSGNIEATLRSLFNREAKRGIQLMDGDIERLREFLLRDEIREYFTDRYRVFTEKEFCDSKGRLYRMDRVAMDDKKVVVIDFKTGTEMDWHLKQVMDYMGLLWEVYPDRQIEGILAYIDTGNIKGIRWERP